MHKKLVIFGVTQTILFSGICLASQQAPLVEYEQSDDETVPTVSATLSLPVPVHRPAAITVIATRQREFTSPTEEREGYQERAANLAAVLDTAGRELTERQTEISELGPSQTSGRSQYQTPTPSHSPCILYVPGGPGLPVSNVISPEIEVDTSVQQNLYAELCETVEEYGTKRVTPEDVRKAVIGHGGLQSAIRTSAGPDSARNKLIKQLSHAATLRFQLPFLLQNEQEMDAQLKDLSSATPSIELIRIITEWKKLKRYRLELFNPDIENITQVDQLGKIHITSTKKSKPAPIEKPSETIILSDDSDSDIDDGRGFFD